jgi:hypothetical protein
MRYSGTHFCTGFRGGSGSGPGGWRVRDLRLKNGRLGILLQAAAVLGCGLLAGCADTPSSTGSATYELQTSLTAATFPSTPVGSTSAADMITLTNTGSGTLTLSPVALKGTGAAAFTVQNGCGATLAPAATCTLGVTFAPTAAATYTAAISIASSAVGSPQTVALTGTGTITLGLSVMPSSLMFGGVETGHAASLPVTVTNTGNGVVTLNSFTILGSGAAAFLVTANTCGATLAVGANCVVTVTFSPTNPGSYVALLSINSNVPGPAVVVSLSGSCFLVNSVSVSGGSLSFAATPVLGTSAAGSVTVTNTGDGAINFTSITLGGSSKLDFALTSATTCSTTNSLAVGATCVVSAVLAPPCTGSDAFTAGAPTQYVATVTLGFNGTNSPQTINLAGQGLSSATAVLTPGTVSWGADGHVDTGAVYAGNACQQIVDLKTVFGSAVDTVFYRMADSVQDTGGIVPADVQEMQAAGILPIVGAVTYPSTLPGWSGVTPSSYSSGYSWAYALVKADAQAAPGNIYWYVGNEWNGQIPGYATVTDPTNPAQWQALTAYPSYLGAMAGAIQAIRDTVPGAVIVSGANGGSTSYGLTLALASDLTTHGEHWDYTNLHWFNDYAYNGTYAAFYESPGYFYGPTTTVHNAYTALNATAKPIFFDEFGASNGDSCSTLSTAATANDAAGGLNATNLMTEMLAHARAVAGTQGIVAGTFYEMYPEPGSACGASPEVDKYLFTSQGVIAAQGTAVANWIAGNGTGANPTTTVAANYSLSSTNVTIAAPGNSGMSTVKLTSGAGFTGNVALSCFVWSEEQTDPTMNPTCSFAGGASTATVSGTQSTMVTVTTQASDVVRNYVVTVVGSSAGAVAETSFGVKLN